jgi:hypothetical protein
MTIITQLNTINMEDEPIIVTCKGCDRQQFIDSWDEVKYHEWMRSDYYGMCTGIYCNSCYATNYPYRKDAYYDPGYCGERMEDDY